MQPVSESGIRRWPMESIPAVVDLKARCSYLCIPDYLLSTIFYYLSLLLYTPCL